MRTLRCILIALLLATTLAGATTINLTSVGPTIGPDADFKVFNTSAITINSGTITVDLYFNYIGATLATPVSEYGVTLNSADLLFQVGSNFYGIATANRPAPGNDLIAGELYSTTGFQTAQQVLGNPSGVSYRNTAYVWLSGSPSPIMALSEDPVTKGAAPGPEYYVHITGSLPTSVVNQIDQYGAAFYFASATCGNGYETGSFTPGSYGPTPPVPEPASLVLLGSGLLGAGGLLRRRVNRK